MMLRKLLLSLFDFRSVYLIRHKRKVKIGISNNTKRRLKEIERSLSCSELKVLASVRVFHAEKIEKRLHSKFERFRRLHKGSGKTEYFKLNQIQIISIKLQLRFIQFLQLFSIILFTSITILILWQISKI